MPESPIGISFIPTAENQAQGPMHGGAETDLGQAFKILSLRLPRVLGAQAPAPAALLNSPGAAGVPGQAGSFNPHASVFEALIRALLGGSAGAIGPDPSGGAFQGGSAGAPLLPHVTPGLTDGEPAPGSYQPGGYGGSPAPTPLPSGIPTWQGAPPGTFHPGGYTGRGGY